MADIYREGVLRRPVIELRPGDLVDLMGDKYADPDGRYALENDLAYVEHTNRPEWEFEYEAVVAIERETADCIRVDFESGVSVGFPADYAVKVDAEQVRE